ncbi:hypothetical protein FQA47_006298 [Oryzias melastigma]|uniref:Uncharacterized protein n=1 Tax=Oryzias melastigma TaxID=30732 RepID=A0A834FQL2_ORYME|nr:hypothetical protein FQA47_006298 [Oryzias melastigma]
MRVWSTAGGFKDLMDPGKDLGEFVSRMESGSGWKLLRAWDTLTNKMVCVRRCRKLVSFCWTGRCQMEDGGRTLSHASSGATSKAVLHRYTTPAGLCWA